MKKSILVITILIIILLIGFNFIKSSREGKAEVILTDILNAISGKDDFLSNNELSEGIKQQLIAYQERNLVSDDTTIVLLDNVEYFNNQIELLKKIKEMEHFYNNIPPDVVDVEKYIEENFNNEDIEVDEKYAMLYDESALNLVDENVIEKDNQYLIKLNDLDISEKNSKIIFHKGLMKEIYFNDLNKETYSMRRGNPKYKYYIVDKKSDLNTVYFICASEFDKHIIEIDVNFKFLIPESINIR